MKFGLTLGAILLASNVAFAQVAIDMATLERKVEDAQAAYDRNQASADRQEMNDIRDELGYLRVKQRRGEAVTRTDRMRLNDRVDRFLLAHERTGIVLDPVSTIGRIATTDIHPARAEAGSRSRAAAKSTCVW